MKYLTIKALTQILPLKKVAELANISLKEVKVIQREKWKIGDYDEQLDPAEVSHIPVTGLRICQACKQRFVPLKPIDYQILTRLCEVCWRGERGSESEMEYPNDWLKEYL